MEGISLIRDSMFTCSTLSELNHSIRTCFVNSCESAALDALCTSADVEDLAILAKFRDCHDNKENSLGEHPCQPAMSTDHPENYTYDMPMMHRYM